MLSFSNIFLIDGIGKKNYKKEKKHKYEYY
jgi:hypothetical protein